MDYTDRSIRQLSDEWQALATPKAKLDLTLFDLANRLHSPRAKVFLTQGVMRRLNLVEHALDRIFDIFAPERSAFLSKIETNDVTSFLHTFVINVYGILENLAWVCVLEGSHPDPAIDHRKAQIPCAPIEQTHPAQCRVFFWATVSQSRRWWNDGLTDVPYTTPT